MNLKCPYCSSDKTIKYGKDNLKIAILVQKYKGKNCQKYFNERTGTPMSRLRHSSEKVALAMKMRSEVDGLRGIARTLEKSHSTIIGWEKPLALMAEKWSPPAPEQQNITLEGDEVYTRVKKTFRPISQKDGR